MGARIVTRVTDAMHVGLQLSKVFVETTEHSFSCHATSLYVYANVGAKGCQPKPVSLSIFAGSAVTGCPKLRMQVIHDSGVKSIAIMILPIERNVRSNIMLQ